MRVDKKQTSLKRAALLEPISIGITRAKWLATLALLLAVALPAPVHAQFTFATNNGALTITKYTGSGAAVTIPGTTNGMPVTSIGNKAFYQSYSVTRITIPDTVTNIAESAFYYCWHMTNVLIPNSVTSIGTNVFASCYDLASVALSTNITTISSSAFYYCYSLTSFTIPDSVTSIGTRAFANCYGLTNVVIGTNVTAIGSLAFDYCNGLTNVTIPKSVTNMADQVFYECYHLLSISVEVANPSYSSLDGVLFNKSQTALIQYPAGNAGTLYTMPDSVTDIEGFSFYGCTKLKNVKIGTNAASIGSYSFYNCSGLTNISIPNSVTSIGAGAFSSCARLLAITVEALNPVYGSVDGVLFNKSQTALIQFPGAKAGSYTVPDGVTSIGDAAFLNCAKLTGATIPNSVTNIGGGAFQGCTSLTAITVNGDNAFYLSVDGVLFNKDQTALIHYPAGKSGTSYTIPNSVTNINNNAFAYNTNLNSVTIGNGVTQIGNNAFYYCTSLNSVTIGSGVTQIGSGAFFSCSNLKTVYFKGNAPSLGAAAFLNDAKATFYYLPGKAGWSSPFGGRPAVLWKPQIQTSDGRFGVGTNGFGFTIAWTSEMIVRVEACTNLANPTWFPLQTNILASNTAYFSDPQWMDCPNRFYRLSWVSAITAQIQDYIYSINNGGITITRYTGSNSVVTIPDSIDGLPVTGIGDNAFDSVRDMTSITIPNSVTYIGSSAFKNCTGLTSVLIPNSIIYLSEGAFRFCTNLTAITVETNNPVYTSVDGVVFDKNQTTLVTFPAGKDGSGYTIPNSVTRIGVRAFFTCTRLTQITVPNSVIWIRQAAFRFCPALTNVTISKSVTLIENLTFADCPNLTGVYICGDAPFYDGSPFDGDVNPSVNVIVYYLPLTTGWGATFGGRPTALWLPLAQNPCVWTNQFGFIISWASGMTVAVDACTDLANPVWTPLQTNTLTADTLYFSDPQWTNHPTRFYRLRWP